MSRTAATRAVLFANVRSGRGRSWLVKVIERAPSAGVSIEATHFDLSPDAVHRALEQAEREGVSTVLAMGGDGTVGSIANCIMDGRWTLGVLPAGTSNDFARSILMPLDPAGALGVIAAGWVARVDMGVANGRGFLHAAAVGLNTEFAERAAALRKVLGRISYPVAALQVFRDRSLFRTWIDVDGRRHEFRALNVAVFNSPVFGGPLELEAGTKLQDGKATALVVERLHLENVIRALPEVLQRRVPDFPGVEVLSASDLILTTEPQLKVTIDGEVVGHTPLTVHVKQRALRVLVPAQFHRQHDESAQ